MPAPKPIVEFAEDSNARIEINVAEKAEKPISPYLFGEFTEHLGSNVYGGAWAQLLDNTGFEPAKYFSREEDAGVERALAQSEEYDLLGSYKAGVACFWGRWGKGDVTYSPSDDRVNSDQAQKIEIRSLQSPEVGLLQPITLPTHRTGKYEVSAWARGTVGKLHVAIRATDGKEVGGSEIEIGSEWKQFKASFEIERKGIEQFQILLFTIGVGKPGTILLDECLVFPADNMKGFDPEIVRLVKDSKITMLRFPGGNFVSGYHWKDGIDGITPPQPSPQRGGSASSAQSASDTPSPLRGGLGRGRPMSRNPAWGGAEPNHVGTDEWLAFCEMTGCEPLICINAGNGTPEEAAQWVEYCNGGSDTEYGKLRAKNGHPEPYGVRYWEIGNELWGDWQIGHCTAEEYADRYTRFYDAMRAADPGIEFIALGREFLDWNVPVLKKNGKDVRSLSIHTLIGNAIPEGTPPDTALRSLLAYTDWYEGHLRAMGKQMADAGNPDPKIAVTELQIFTNRGGLPNNVNLSEALFYAGIVNASIRTDGLVEIITHSALVNHGGGLAKWRQVVCEQPVFLARKMYATQPGRVPVHLSITTPTYDIEALPGVPAGKDVPYLDAVALLDESGKELCLLVTNRHPSDAITAEIALDAFEAGPRIITETLTSKSYLDANSPGDTDVVKTKKSVVKTKPEGMTHTFPAHSLTRLRFRRP